MGTVDLFIIGATSNNIGASLKALEDEFGKKIHYTLLDDSEYKVKKEKGRY